jgi:hypothetical protein
VGFGLGEAMAATIFLLVIFLTFLKSWLGLVLSASLQMAEYWYQISMATRFFQQQGASFHGDRCAGSSGPEMLNAELGKRKGFDHRFGEDFGPSVGRKTQGSRETSSARETFVALHGSRDRWRRTGYKVVSLIFDKTGKPTGEYRGLRDRFRKMRHFFAKRRLAKPS